MILSFRRGTVKSIDQDVFDKAENSDSFAGFRDFVIKSLFMFSITRVIELYALASSSDVGVKDQIMES